MTGKKYLFLALDAGAWGRAALGVDIARTLVERGDEVRFIANNVTAPLLRQSFAVDEIPDQLGTLSRLYVETCFQSEKAQVVILCDIHSCARYFDRRGVDPGFLFRCGMPVLALDLWNYTDRHGWCDAFGVRLQPKSSRMTEVTARLVPVPISRPTVAGAYCSLPRPANLTYDIRSNARSNLGLKNDDLVVLFCTAGWQHGINGSKGQQLAVAVPQLLWRYVSQIDRRVRLIHVGPEALAIGSGEERYLWMPAMAPQNFSRLLGSVDLVLSANVSATTIGRAIALGLPVVVVQNSYRAGTVEEIEHQAGISLSAGVRQWLEKALPIYPFSMWPLGFWEFLKPLLQNNPYCEAIDLVELLDEAGVVERCRHLLLDRKEREAAIGRQQSYANRVRGLPRAAELIDQYLK